MKIGQFFKQVFTISIAFLVSVLSLLLVAFFIFSKLTDTQHSSHPIKKNSVLELSIEGIVVEQLSVSLFGQDSGMVDLREVKKAIHQATEDDHISAIYLKLSHLLSGGWAALEEIREALLSFKGKGKIIVAYGDNYSQKAYYLASVADEIVISPSGYLEFKGLSVTVNFYTALFKNIAIEPIVFRIGDYKSAVEPFSLTQMSKESKEQTTAYLSPIYNHFLTRISCSRNITVADLKAFACNLSAILPSDALSATLVTKIETESRSRLLLKERLHNGVKHATDLSFITYKNYITAKKERGVTDKIAVFIIEGTIVDGETRSGYVGAHDFVKVMETIQKDATIKALVLRINSPGGGVQASDNMWHAIEDIKLVKPVVASMSNIAASGGYYIAAPCHYIFAQPTTLTGSIGIFALLFDPTKLMTQIGIQCDVVKTAPSADWLSPRTTCRPIEAKFLYKMLQVNYDAFLHKVAQGRGLPLLQVEKLASGRVYAGITAQKNELVDELGGLEEALAKAAILASLTGKYEVCYFPRPRTKWELLLDCINKKHIRMEILADLVQKYPILNHLQMIDKCRGLQALLPYTINID